MEENAKQNIIIAEMKKDICYIRKSVDKLTKTVEEHIDECEERYANKWVENAMKFVMGAISLSIIGAFMAVILN